MICSSSVNSVPSILIERDRLRRQTRLGIHRHISGEERHVLQRENRREERVRLGRAGVLRRLDVRVDVVAADRLERVRLGRASLPLGVLVDELRDRGSGRVEPVRRVHGSVHRASARVDEQRRVVAVRGDERESRRRPSGAASGARRSPARRSARRGRPVPDSAFWIFVTCGPNSVWPILNVSSPTTSPPQIWANASAKKPGMSFVYGISGEPST